MAEEASKESSKRTPAASAAEGKIAYTLTPDTIDERYTIDMSTTIPDLDTSQGKAYAASDSWDATRSLYAIICTKGMPYRTQIADGYSSVMHPALVKLEVIKVVFISTLKECRTVMIFERPSGKRLSSIINSEYRLPSKSVVKDIIIPLFETMQECHQNNFCLGHIHPDRLFFNDKATPKLRIGECLSEPPSVSQDPIYQSIQRCISAEFGKGEPLIKDDFFALGILCVFMFLGYIPGAAKDKVALLRHRMSAGSYIAIVDNWSFTDVIDNLIKGLLNDNPAERWGHEHLNNWLDGKRFNLITPHIHREAPRPFTFLDTQHFTGMNLAHTIANNWEESKVMLREDKLIRWIELSMSNSELAATVKNVVWDTGGDHPNSPSDDDELTAKSILLLDPEGPIRFKGLSFFPRAFGTIFADYYRTNNRNAIILLEWILKNELAGFWSGIESPKLVIDPVSNKMLETMQKYRILGRMKGLGFGTERMLYEFNPTLPCLSPMISRYHANTSPELLLALDHFSRDAEAKSKDPIDDHIAAFIMTKLKITSNIRSDLDGFRQYQDFAPLRHLNLLVQAQGKFGNYPLPGLTEWMVSRLMPMTDNLFNHKLRKKVRESMRETIPLGNLKTLQDLVANAKLITKDKNDFNKAVALHNYNQKKIQNLDNIEFMAEKAERIGSHIALAIGYITLLIAVLNFLQDYIKNHF